MGANPKRKRRSTRRRNPLNPARRRRRAGRSYLMRGRRRANPMINRKRYSRRRSYRRNPATAIAISARRPMSLLVPALAGTGGFFAADYIPAAIGMTASPMTRIGVKAGVAFGGGMVISRFMGSKVGTAFAIGAGINLMNDVLRTYIFKNTIATTGFGAFAPPRTRLQGFGAMSPYSSIRSPYAS